MSTSTSRLGESETLRDQAQDTGPRLLVRLVVTVDGCVRKHHHAFVFLEGSSQVDERVKWLVGVMDGIGGTTTTFFNILLIMVIKGRWLRGVK